MKTPNVKSILISASLVLAPAILSAQTPRMSATPGTVNYTEGLVSIGNTPVRNMNRNQPPVLRANDVLNTTDGKAEILLSPGTFLRVGKNSAVRMVTPELVDPRVEVLRGEAMVEVDQKLKDAHINVMQRDSDSSILKEGLYRFNADQGRVEVIDGKLRVNEGQQAKEIGKGKEIILNSAGALQTASFDRKAEDDLYAFSNLRSHYMAEASASTVRYIGAGYGPWAGAGWYWNPYFTSWAWLPGDGLFYSPFGYGFYSPLYAGYGFRGGFYGRPRAFVGGSGFRGGASVSMAGRSGAAFHGGGGRR
jgi:hypothetical protein